MVSDQHMWPNPADAPAEADLTRCVHCGLCLTSCPTYMLTGLEAESPRGRIYLARAVAEGDIPLTVTVQQHWDQCLQCRACEVACPSGVPYGRIMEHTRAQVAARPASGARGRSIRRFLLRHIVASKRLLPLATAPARILAKPMLRKAVRISRVLRVSPLLAQLEAQLPTRIGAPFRAGDAITGPSGDANGRAILFTGCVMGELFGDVHRATARVLGRRGIAAEAVSTQGCCGALHAHDGDLDFARELARRNIDGLEATAPAPIVVNSAGCGAAMKEYGELLEHDPRYADRARAFARRVRDLSEVLASLPPVPARSDAKVSYQHACHLAHAQRIRAQPLDLLDGVDGINRVTAPGDDTCCGAAGIYSLVQPRMSGDLRALKAASFAASRPDIVVTANPGCQMQYNAAIREAGVKSRVLHLAEFLDEAEAAAER